MKLDELKWVGHGEFKRAVVRAGGVRWRVVECNGLYFFIPGSTDRGRTAVWRDLDHMAAQCVLYHLTGNPESNSNG